MPDVKEFKLPDIGEGLTEGEIVSWMVKPGDTVALNQNIVEVETAKVTVELPSPYAGVVVALLYDEGATVDVGAPIIQIDVDSGGTSAAGSAASPAEPAGAAATGSESEKMLVGYGPKATVAKRRARTGAARSSGGSGDSGTLAASSAEAAVPDAQASPEAVSEDSPYEHLVPTPSSQAETSQAAAASEAAQDTGAAQHTMTAAPASSQRARAKPPVRKLAKDLGIELASVTATGADGVITRNDVEAHASDGRRAAAAAAASEPTAATAPELSRGERETRISIKGVRKMTAQAMVSSAFTAPHVTEWITVDATRTMGLVKQLRRDREFAGLKVSPLLIVARAACLAIRRTPEVNATWDEAAQEIVLKRYVNLGIAAATGRGLIVPNIKDADAMSAAQLAAALGTLTTSAREGKTSQADVAGGTFTITNVGVFGVDSGTPILNPGESGILCMGAIRKQPWVVGNKVRPRWITTLALSFDHRIVDGQQGSKFLSDVASIIETPRRALLF
ncbi:MAG: dihydrolipoamide acetyltransferase family protein [Nocardioidaceae bacterium]